MSTTIKHNGWVIEFSDEPGRVYISNDQHPGNIHVKAEVEGYVVDIWRDSYEEVESGASALYSDLSDMSVDDELPARALIRAHRKATKRLQAVKRGAR